MGDTVDALSYKADVKGRAKDNVSGKVESIKEKVTGVTGSVSGRASDVGGRVSDATPSAAEVKHGARRAAGIAQENPIGLAIGATAVGFLAGLLVPSTRVEDEHLGPVADTVKEKVRETGSEALDRGKQVAQAAASSAAETAREEGATHAQELKDSAQTHAQDVQQTAQQSAQDTRERVTS
jgi:gas vesicle protein